MAETSKPAFYLIGKFVVFLFFTFVASVGFSIAKQHISDHGISWMCGLGVLLMLVGYGNVYKMVTT